MASFVGLYTGLSGIQAAQTGLDITSNNVANANTPGYTRQRVEFTARASFQSPSGQIGTGVDVLSIARLRDAFLDDRFRAAVGQQAESTIRAEFHTNLEFLSGEPDLGITARIGELWGAAEEWANDPNDPAVRRQVLSELASIVDGFQATAMAWDRLGEDTAASRDVVLAEVNRTLDAIEGYNAKLANADPSRVGGDLLDERDLLVDRLAQLVGSTSRIQEDGTVTIELGGTELLSHPTGAATFTITTGVPGAVGVVPAGAPPADPAVDVTLVLSGELGGLNQVIEVDLPAWRTQLDDLAVTFASAVNQINERGRLASGALGGSLLDLDPLNAAASLARTTDQIADLAAGDAGDPPTAGPAPAPFDGTNARALADLRTTRLTPGGIPDPDGATIESKVADLVIGLASAVRSARSTAEASHGVATGARLARAAEHGVSIDEEMVGLVRYQRALEAAARVMTTVDQALDTLVNRVGIVGR